MVEQLEQAQSELRDERLAKDKELQAQKSEHEQTIKDLENKKNTMTTSLSEEVRQKEELLRSETNLNALKKLQRRSTFIEEKKADRAKTLIKELK